MVNNQLSATMMERQHWYFSQLAPDSTAYTLPVVLHCTGKIDIIHLKKSINAVLNSDEIFRVGYRLENGELFRVSNSCNQVRVDVVDASRPSFDDASPECIDQIRSILFKKFDMEKGPLINVAILKFSTDEILILLGVHHVIADLESVKIFLSEVEKRYNSANGFENLGSSRFTYNEFSNEHKKWLNSEDYTKMLNFWKNEVETIRNEQLLFSDDSNSSVSLFAGKDIHVDIPKELSDKVKLCSSLLKVNPFTILLSAYYLLLYNYSRRGSVTVGVPFTNRRDERLADTFGEFANILPLTINGTESKAFRNFVKKVRQKLLLTHRNQEVPLECIVADYGARSLDNPFYQVGFTFEPLLSLNLNNANVKRIHISKQSSQLALYAFFRYDEEQNINGYFEYMPLVGDNTAEKLVSEYRNIISSVVDNVDIEISKFFRNDSENSSEKVVNVEKTKALENSNEKKLVINATFTADNLENGLNFWIDRLKLNWKFQFAGYRQVIQQMLDPKSLVRQNSNGYNVILLRLDDLTYEGFIDVNNKSYEKVESKLVERCKEIQDILSFASGEANSTYIVVFCPSSPDVMADKKYAEIIEKVQGDFTIAMNSIPGVFAINSKTVFSWYPISDYHDPVRLEHGHIPYTSKFFSILATVIVRRIFIMQQKPIKVIAVDCDNTLWKGVAAEDGAENVVVDSGYSKFQELLVGQVPCGRLVTLVSKNYEDVVDNVFTKNNDMKLREESIFSKRINWNAKSENIRSLAKEINVGMDGFLFIDDNPGECNEVATTLPLVSVVQFPDCDSNIEPFFSGLWMLDIIKNTEEDLKRANYYTTEKLRNNVKSKSLSFSDFLNQLQLEVTFDSLNNKNGERLSQLTYRTNQFNLTAKKYTHKELLALTEDGYEITSVSVRDRFGDYGIVGMIVCKAKGSALHIDTFLLSCRVLCRGVEYRMVKCLADMNYSRLHFNVVSTGRNKPAIDFIDNVEKQCCSAKREELDLIITSEDGLALSFITDSDEKDVLDRSSQVKSEVFSEDVLKRNRAYKDIAENLYSFEKIVDAVESFSMLNKTEIAVDQVKNLSCSPIEKEIIAIWEKITGFIVANTNVNFFDAGGKSLQLPQVLVELKNQFNVDIVLVDLFKYPTVSMISKFISSKSMSPKPVEQTNSGVAKKMLSGMASMRRIRKK